MNTWNVGGVRNESIMTSDSLVRRVEGAGDVKLWLGGDPVASAGQTRLRLLACSHVMRSGFPTY